MLATALPLVPFAQQPRKEWKVGLEKKPRLNLHKFDKKFRDVYYIEGDSDYDSDDSSVSDVTTDGSPKKKDAEPKGGRKFKSRAFYEEEYDEAYDERKKQSQLPPIKSDNGSVGSNPIGQAGMDGAAVAGDAGPNAAVATAAVAGTDNPDFMDNVAFLLANPQLLTTGTKYLKEQIKHRRMLVLLSKEFKEKYFKSPMTLFMEWKEEERLRRVHYIYKEYEDRIKAYDEKLKAEAQKEIEEDERAVLIEAYKSAERIKKSLFKKKNKLAVNRKTIEKMQQREREQVRMEYNYTHLPVWAVERYREKVQLKEDQERQDAENERIRKRKELEDTIEDMDAADRELYEEDCQITQEVTSIMRRCGMYEGVNAKDHHILPQIKQKEEKEINKLTISLKHNVDFSKMSNMRTKHEYYYPFDQEISERASELKILKARGIGERGALCLSADFVRNQLPLLEVLDLSNCEMQTRGMGRVLRGVKLAKYRGLEVIKLNGNHITCKGLEYVRDLFDSELFDNLKVLDLSDNELGDGCAESIIRMIFAGSLRHLRELHLQNNNIKDLGFSKLIKIVRSVYMDNCPHLERLGLERNPISAAIKRELAPLPAMVSV